MSSSIFSPAATSIKSSLGKQKTDTYSTPCFQYEIKVIAIKKTQFSNNTQNREQNKLCIKCHNETYLIKNENRREPTSRKQGGQKTRG